MPVEGSDEQKQTNEILTAAPLLDKCEIAGKVITADALLTQHKLASYIVGRGADYHLTAKGNQPHLQEAITTAFDNRSDTPDFVEVTPPDHGRIETRSIWCSTAVNKYLKFPSVGQVFLIKRETVNKKTSKSTCEIVVGLTSQTPAQASPEKVLAVNRGHWCIEAAHYVIDWNFNEDRSRIRTKFGPENTTLLRRLATSVLRLFQKPGQSIATMMRRLGSNNRMVLDYLRMTKNSVPVAMRGI